MSTRSYAHVKRAGWLAIALGTLLLIPACGALAPPAPSQPATPPVQPVPVGEDVGWPGDESNMVQLDVVNSFATDICYLYISPPGDVTWGGDWLGGTQTVPPGETWSGFVPAGRYDLMVEDCNHSMLGETRGFDLTAARTFTPGGGETGVAIATTTTTTEGVTLYVGLECPPPGVTPQDTVTARMSWVTATVEQAESNADVMDFVAWLDGDLIRDATFVRRPARTWTPAQEIGCGPNEPVTSVEWDLSLGRLSPGTHLFEVEFFNDAEINDGFNTYPPGSLGISEQSITVAGDGGSADTVTLTLVNDTQDTVCFVWIGAPGSEWIDDLLGDSLLDAGTQFAVDLVPGTWALQAEDCSGAVVGYEAAFDLTGAAEWHISG